MMRPFELKWLDRISETIDHALKIDLHTLYRVNNPHEKTFPAPQGVHRHGGLEMEVDSPPVARREARRKAGPPDSPQGPMHTAIQEVEGFLKGRGLLERIGNAWGHVKKAALEGVEPWGGKDASRPPAQVQDIQDIKEGLAELARTVQDLKEQGKPKKPTYAEAARSQGSSGYVAQTSNAHTLPVPKRHY